MLEDVVLLDTKYSTYICRLWCSSRCGMNRFGRIAIFFELFVFLFFAGLTIGMGMRMRMRFSFVLVLGKR